jgi:hypothetical protein
MIQDWFLNCGIPFNQKILWYFVWGKYGQSVKTKIYGAFLAHLCEYSVWLAGNAEISELGRHRYFRFAAVDSVGHGD